MKFDELTDEELVETIMHCARELGWNVAIPVGEDEDVVTGLILGTQEYLDSVVSNTEATNGKVTH